MVHGHAKDKDDRKPAWHRSYHFAFVAPQKPISTNMAPKIALPLACICALLSSIEAAASVDGAIQFLRGIAERTGNDEARVRSAGRRDGPFGNDCLRGRFSYANRAGDVASVSVGVFDGAGTIAELDDIAINAPDGNGGRVETSFRFNGGEYEVYGNGRGRMSLSLGEEGGPYYDPPAQVEFVVTGTGDGRCEITAMESFLVASVGVANQLVAPTWSKIATW